MNLLDYIKGNRKGKAAHKLERESMDNPFLYEAMEGLDNVEGNHAENIAELYTLIGKKSQPKVKRFKLVRQITAACAVGLLFTISLFLVDGNNSNLVAQQRFGTAGIMEIYVPNEYYAENITFIAKKNSEEIKEYREEINIVRPNESKLANNMDTKEILIAENNSPVNIFMPDEIDRYTNKERSEVFEETQAPQRQVEMSRRQNKGGVVPNIITGQNLDLEERLTAPSIGYQGYETYIQKNMRRSDTATKGEVFLLFNIDDDGKPYSFKIIKSLGLEQDREAVRLIKAAGTWTRPAQNIYYRVEF